MSTIRPRTGPSDPEPPRRPPLPPGERSGAREVFIAMLKIIGVFAIVVLLVAAIILGTCFFSAGF